MAVRFKALQNFSCSVTKSEYEADQAYTIRDGNDALARRVALWVDEGRVAMLAPGSPMAQVSGGGKLDGKKEKGK